MADFTRKSAIFALQGPLFQRVRAGASGRNIATVAGFVYELCYTKRRVNADKLVRIT